MSSAPDNIIPPISYEGHRIDKRRIDVCVYHILVQKLIYLLAARPHHLRDFEFRYVSLHSTSPNFLLTLGGPVSSWIGLG
jgi:hypothetical protein